MGTLLIGLTVLVFAAYVVLSMRQINRRRDTHRVVVRGWRGWEWDSESDLPEFEDWRRAA